MRCVWWTLWATACVVPVETVMDDPRPRSPAPSSEPSATVPETTATTSGVVHEGEWGWGRDNGGHNADASFVGDGPGDWAGGCLVAPGDVNGDGFDDLVISAPRRDGLAVDGGKAYFVFGGPRRAGRQPLSKAPSVVGDEEGMELCQVTAVGDLNGDGLPDVGFSTGYSNVSPPGGEYVVFGKTSGWDKAIPVSEADVVAKNVHADGVNDLGGTGYLGDMDGDGIDDWLLFGQVLFNGEGHVVSGADAVGALELPTDSKLWVYGDTRRVRMARAGDLDGDGLADMVVVDVDGPRSRLVFGSSAGLPHDQSADAVAVVRFKNTERWSGLSPVGDVDGDGMQDLAVRRGGGISLILGRTAWPPSMTEEDADVQLDWSGGRVAPAGDLNADGIDDLVMVKPGQLDLLFGRSSWGASVGPDVVIELRPEASLFITPELRGDLDGDGLPELIVADPYVSVDERQGAGQVLVFAGRRNWEGQLDAGDADARFLGTASWQALGHLGAVVDLDRDGIDDLVLGAPSYPVDTLEGETFVYYGRPR